MPKLKLVRRLLATIAVTLGALGYAKAEPEGTLSLLAVEADGVPDAGTLRRGADFLRRRLAGGGDAVVGVAADGGLAVWTPHDAPVDLDTLLRPAAFGIHPVDDRVAQADLARGAVSEGFRVSADAQEAGRLWAIADKPLIGPGDIAQAEAGVDPLSGEALVRLRFTDAAAGRFGDWTGRNIGRPIAIVLDGAVLSAPVIREPILGGAGQISGNFTVEEARSVAARLTPAPPGVTGFRVIETCAAAQPRAPPGGAMIWSRPAVMACD